MAASETESKEGAPHIDSDYHTFIAVVDATHANIKVIAARTHPRITNRTGFVYAYSPSLENPTQLFDVYFAAVEYVRKYYPNPPSEQQREEREDAMNVYIEKLMRGYATEFSLLKLWPDDFA